MAAHAKATGGSTPALTAQQLTLNERSAIFDDIYVPDGTAIVCLSYDDGPSQDYTGNYQLLRDRYLPATFAVCAGPSPGSIGIGEASRMTWAQVQEMHDHGMEIACHSRTHGSPPADVAAFTDEAVTAADVVAAANGSFQLAIDSFVQPGSWNTGPYFFDATTKVDNTTAGDLLRSRYQIATAYVTDNLWRQVTALPVSRQIGAARGSDLSTILTLAAFQAKVAEARGKGGMLACGTHYGNINQGGFTTLANYTAILDWIQAERDAGRIYVYTLAAAYSARRISSGRRNLCQSGFEKDATGNYLGWIVSGGAPFYTAGDAPSGKNSIGITSASDIIIFPIPAQSVRSIEIRFKAKNHVPGVNVNARILVKAVSSDGLTTYNSLDMRNGGAGTNAPPGPWPALTDAWQSFKLFFRPDPRASELRIWPYFGSGQVRYADFEIYKT